MTRTFESSFPIPYYSQAVALLVRLAGPVFDVAMHRVGGPTPGENTFEAWLRLRCVIHRFVRNKHTALPDDERERLIAALRHIHELEHIEYAEPMRDPAICQCPAATTMRELALVFEEAGTSATDAERPATFVEWVFETVDRAMEASR